MAKLERGLAVAEAFQGSMSYGVALAKDLCRAYVQNGEVERALTTAEKSIATWSPEMDIGIFGQHQYLLCEYSWMLRACGRSRQALAFVDKWLSVERKRPLAYLTAERARCLYAEARFEEAAKVLENLVSRVAEDPESWRWEWPGLCAMRGLLRERAGDEAGAKEIWKKAKIWRTDSGIWLFEGVLAASLAGNVSGADLRKLAGRVPSHDAPVAIGLITSSVGEQFLSADLFKSVMNNAFRTPRGKELAPKIAFHLIPFDEYARSLPTVFLYEFFRQTALPADANAAQDEMAWSLAEQSWRAAVEEATLDATQMVPLAMAWKKPAGYVGWDGVAPRLSPELRGPLGYMLALRYRRINHPQEAEKILQAARADAPPGSTLSKFVEAELQRVPKPNEPKP